MTIGLKTERIRSRTHLDWIKTLPCAIPGCRGDRIDPAHLRCAEPSGMGIKPGDDKCTPLCRRHHDEQHRAGDERAWWEAKRIDPIALAEKFWKASPHNPDNRRDSAA